MEIHILNVWQWNMSYVTDWNTSILVDCNITEKNEKSILSFIDKVNWINKIDYFINTHTDSDHIRWINKIKERYWIWKIWDSWVPWTTIDEENINNRVSKWAEEHKTYKKIKEEVWSFELLPENYIELWDFLIMTLNWKNDNYQNSKDQSLILKFLYLDWKSIIFSGDASYKPWKDYIVNNYWKKLKSNFLVAPDNGSIDFFYDHYLHSFYTSHLEYIKPQITIVSTWNNSRGLPSEKSLKLYEKYTIWSDQWKKIVRTDKHGNIKIVFNKWSWWNINVNQ